MRHKIEDVMFYLDELNAALFDFGVPVRYAVETAYGKKNIVVYDANGRHAMLGTVRCGLTMGEAYDVVYAMARVAEDISRHDDER